MDHLLREFWEQLRARPSGPLAFRFYFQPFMAFVLATRDGIRDAHSGKSAYFWGLFGKDKTESRARLHAGWHSISRVFFLALVLDFVYQLVELKSIRPVEGLVIAVVLAIVPYLLVRGPVNRIVSRFGRHETPSNRTV